MHHHVAGLIIGFADQGNAFGNARIAGPCTFDLGAHPFGPRPGLTCAAPAHDDPCAPVAIRGHLVVKCPKFEKEREGKHPPFPNVVKKLILQLFRLGGEQGAPRFQHAPL